MLDFGTVRLQKAVERGVTRGGTRIGHGLRLSAITPTAFARTPIARFIVNTVTDDGLTLDIVVRSAPAPIVSPTRGYAVGMLSSLQLAPGLLAQVASYGLRLEPHAPLGQTRAASKSRQRLKASGAFESRRVRRETS